MHIAADVSQSLPSPGGRVQPIPQSTDPESGLFPHKIMRRKGVFAGFEPAMISVAMIRALLVVEGPGACFPRIRDLVAALTDGAVVGLLACRVDKEFKSPGSILAIG